MRGHDFGSAGPITVSGGVALQRPDETFEDALLRADAALYAAKDGGRDRVAAAGPLGVLAI